MTTNPPILANSAKIVPVAVALGLAWDLQTAAAALLSSLVVLLNLWVLSLLGPMLVRDLAKEDPRAGLWAAALLAKFVLMAAAYAWMARSVPPIGVALGFLPMVGGTLLTAVMLALAEARAEAGEEEGA